MVIRWVTSAVWQPTAWVKWSSKPDGTSTSHPGSGLEVSTPVRSRRAGRRTARARQVDVQATPAGPDVDLATEEIRLADVSREALDEYIRRHAS
ncbi:MAG: hypothetical protein ACYCS7_11000 [Acidimicrobiales bacterium]